MTRQITTLSMQAIQWFHLIFSSIMLKDQKGKNRQEMKDRGNRSEKVSQRRKSRSKIEGEKKRESE
jgi:hypothetical protein